jgi:hypothetical protein
MGDAYRDFDLVSHEHLRDERETLALGGETRGGHRRRLLANDADHRFV